MHNILQPLAPAKISVLLLLLMVVVFFALLAAFLERGSHSHFKEK
jgi:hypothetical protein